jgi:class 3 adenylate cyclase
LSTERLLLPAHLVREAIVEKAFVRLGDALANFSAELWTEAGPFPPAGPVLAKLAKLACTPLSPLLASAVYFRTPGTTAAKGNDHIQNLQMVLQELQQCSLRLEGTVNMKSVEAFKTICDCRTNVDALKDRVDVYLSTNKHVAKMIDDVPVKKVVVELDLARYGDLARMVEDAVDVEAVARLNQMIRTLVSDAIVQAGADPEETVLLNIGDGAILAFDGTESGALQAHHFAEALQRQSELRNNHRDHKAHFHFRIGVNAGHIILRPNLASSGEIKGYTMAGMAIAHAVRLEAACPIGAILISSTAWKLLPDKESNAYGNQEVIAGKRGETILAHLRTVIAPCAACVQQGVAQA